MCILAFLILIVSCLVYYHTLSVKLFSLLNINTFLSSLLSHSECKIVDNVLLWVLFPIARDDTLERCRDEIDPTKMKYEVTPTYTSLHSKLPQLRHIPFCTSSFIIAFYFPSQNHVPFVHVKLYAKNYCFTQYCSSK